MRSVQKAGAAVAVRWIPPQKTACHVPVKSRNALCVSIGRHWGSLRVMRWGAYL
jgi:hypothetical protein